MDIECIYNQLSRLLKIICKYLYILEWIKMFALFRAKEERINSQKVNNLRGTKQKEQKISFNSNAKFNFK